MFAECCKGQTDFQLFSEYKLKTLKMPTTVVILCIIKNNIK